MSFSPSHLYAMHSTSDESMILSMEMVCLNRPQVNTVLGEVSTSSSRIFIVSPRTCSAHASTESGVVAHAASEALDPAHVSSDPPTSRVASPEPQDSH